MILRPVKLLVNSRRFLSITNIQLKLKASIDDRFVIVEDSGKSMKFPSVWLRDNCRCENCFHESSQSKTGDWFDVNVSAQKISTDEASGTIKIRWGDNHKSKFDLNWLKEREFSKDNQQKYLNTFYRPHRVHWSKCDFTKILEEFEYKNILNSDKSLKDWLNALAVYGVALIKDAPKDKKVCKYLTDRVGFIKRTHYGKEFIVQAKPDTKNFAYQSSFLPLHTDLPYYDYAPGVNVLHCMVQTQSPGGVNLLADAYYVADRLKREFPDYFDVLTKTPVNWNDIGEEDGCSFHSINISPVICVDKEGAYKRINVSVPQRDSHFSVNLEQVIPWYYAYGKFVELLQEEATSFKASPGEVLTFSNTRLLHGRTAYTDKLDNTRYVIGAYMDWDIIFAKLRVLQNIV